MLKLLKFLGGLKERRPEGPQEIAQGAALGEETKHKKRALKGRHTAR
jgi:hypothetical protein